MNMYNLGFTHRYNQIRDFALIFVMYDNEFWGQGEKHGVMSQAAVSKKGESTPQKLSRK